MKLYLISQNVESGYDTYDSAVVVAPNGEVAKSIHPSGYTLYDYAQKKWYSPMKDGTRKYDTFRNDSWASDPKDIEAEEIGYTYTSGEPGVICSSYNAG